MTQCADDVSVRNVVVETVRSMSSENATVDADCMSIMLPPPELCRAEIAFIVGRRRRAGAWKPSKCVRARCELVRCFMGWIAAALGGASF